MCRRRRPSDETFLDRERGASVSLSFLFSSDGDVFADVFAVVVVVMVFFFFQIHLMKKFATEINHQSHDDGNDGNDRCERAKGWRAASERRRETTAPSSEEQQNQQQQHE